MECATQQMKNTQNGGLIVIGETVVTLHRETPGAKVCITTDIYKSLIAVIQSLNWTLMY